jgi:hypothetical protein
MSTDLLPCPCCKAEAEETYGAKGTEFEGLFKICCATTNTDNDHEYPNGCPLECETVWCATLSEAAGLWNDRDTYAAPATPAPESPAPAPVDLENFTISELCDLIEEARTVARAKQRKMQAACYCHRSPPCHYCVEGGHDEIP